ncbi:MAG: hypothetical protein V3U84_01455 [Thiotrichaceae bacterium]
MQKLVSFTQPIYRNLSRKNKTKWQMTTPQLSTFPINSLGWELDCFLKEYNYTLMAQFESHDVFHVLLQYQPTVLDEARMQYCLAGSGRRSLYALGTCILAALIYPEYWKDFKSHFVRGTTLKHFSYWSFEIMLSIDIQKLRREIQKNQGIITGNH